MNRPTNRLFAASAGLAACGLIITGCSSGQISQTADQESAVNGSTANVKNIALRNVHLQAVQTGDYLKPGRTVELVFAAVNTSADVNDKLLGITSDVGSVSITGDLATVHARRPHTDTPEEIAATAAQVRDPNFRVQVAHDGIHVYNRDGHRIAADAFTLWPQLQLENDASHAFYMGVELARAELAFQLGKRYVQDQPLDWGCAIERPADDLARWCAPGTTMTTNKPAAKP